MATKEILLVTNYFPPEQGAASNRMHAMAIAFTEKGYNVSVVCPFPNYPNGIVFDEFKGKLYSKSTENAITIHRLWLWASNSSNKFVRLLSMLSFAFSLKIFFLFTKTPKTVFVQYSPVFVGFTSVLVSRILRKKTVLNVSDLWPLAGLEMGLLSKGTYYTILEKMEHFCYRNAHLVVGQSQEILVHVKEMVPSRNTFLYRNVPSFIPLKPIEKPSTRITMVYAGLLGVAQGIYAICSKIVLPENVEFHIYGGGPEQQHIAGLAKLNIFYHGEVSRVQLHQELVNYDIAFIPLTNRIYGSVPSKIFEYSRLGLPLLYYAGGEGGDLVSKNELGWVVPVNCMEKLNQTLASLTAEKLREFPKKKVQQRAIKAFNFDAQFENFINILEKNKTP